MPKTFFFYDLETSGLSAQDARIMQFAGIRTTMELEQIGEPYNILVKLPDDTLPSPEALMVTGITPQDTQADGYTEAEFAKLLLDEVFIEDTIAVGFNNISFDDEFIRHLFWRTFHDPYEWTWKDGRSRWDLLDVVRMTRALRPDGIEWPVDKDGNQTNRLEELAKANKLDHVKAHDALSDVEALIGVTRLIKDKQPQLYEYLLKMRDKNEIKKLVNVDEKQPFVYVHGYLDAAFNKATIAFPLATGKNGGVVVYDLRIDPTPFFSLSQKELGQKLYASWDERRKDGFIALPTKELQYNKVPAVAPLGVLAQNDSWTRIGLSEDTITANRNLLLGRPDFADNIRSLYEGKREYKKSSDPEAQLYDSFVPEIDKLKIETVRNAPERELVDYHPSFSDERLGELLLHYKARNYPKTLSQDETLAWEKWRSARINSELPAFSKSLQKLAGSITDESKQFVLQELQLWAESVLPAELEV